MPDPHDGPILALDLGTTSCKAVLVGSDGTVLAQAAEPVRTSSPAPGFAEQDPEEVVAAAEAAVRKVAGAQGVVPRGLALSSAMHSMLAVDGRGRPLFAARTWADARGADVAERWRVEGADRELLQRTGTPVHASSPACKIAHLRAAEPEVFARAARFCSLKEYLCARWLGAWVVDESIASSSGLFDLERRGWCDDVLARAGIEIDRLGELVPTDRVIGELPGAIAGELSLPVNLPVVVGASDGVLQNLGVGAVTPGIAALNLGTSAAVRAIAEAPGEHAERGLFCYVLDRERFVVGGAVNNAGLVVDWLGKVLFAGADDPHAAVLEAAAASAQGAGGVR